MAGGRPLQHGICSRFPKASPEDLVEWTKVMFEKILLATELNVLVALHDQY